MDTHQAQAQSHHLSVAHQGEQGHEFYASGKYQENTGDTLSAFVNLVCQEAQISEHEGPGRGEEDCDQATGHRDDERSYHHYGHGLGDMNMPLLPPPPPPPMARAVTIIRSTGSLGAGAHQGMAEEGQSPPAWNFFSTF